ncbi:MAG: SMP-30/gluconolactonase/LRE family protein [Planctomycetota bacterium]
MVEIAAATGDLLGEGPVHVASANALRWVDIHGRRWHSLDLASGEIRTIELTRRLTAFAPIANDTSGRCVASFDSGLAICDASGVVERWLHQPEADRATNRFNDGGTDLEGRFLAGTMNEADASPTGSLYALDADGSLRVLRRGIGIANTIAFAPDGRVLYTADSATGDLGAYEYDPSTGALGARVDRFRPPDDLPGVPDGSAVDEDGCIWNARWGGSCVVRLRPDGSLDRTLALPATQPTSCAFVGHRLFVTSARCDLSEGELAQQPEAGSLFVASVGIGGLLRPPAARAIAGL